MADRFICCDHPMDEANTIVRRTRDGQTSRTCRTCTNERQRRRYASTRELV